MADEPEQTQPAPGASPEPPPEGEDEAGQDPMLEAGWEVFKWSGL